MHELSIAEGIIDCIEKQRKKYKFARPKMIELICGKYNCLSEENIQFCFSALTKSTYMEGARLKITKTENAINEILITAMEVEP